MHATRWQHCSGWYRQLALKTYSLRSILQIRIALLSILVFKVIVLGTTVCCNRTLGKPVHDSAAYTERSWEPSWEQRHQDFLGLCLSLLGLHEFGIELARQIYDGIIPVKVASDWCQRIQQDTVAWLVRFRPQHECVQAGKSRCNSLQGVCVWCC